MVNMLTSLLAYGPLGGIDGSVAVKWTTIWTVVLGGLLYLSLYYPSWLPPLPSDEKKTK